jgi:hypothetical protein
VHAQALPPGALEQLDTLVGDRVETLFILGTQSGASGGTYLSDVNDTAVDVFKITGRGDLGYPKPIGDSGVGWNLLFEGGIGHATYTNRFNTNQLAGNESEVETFAASLGAGVRFTFFEVSVSRRRSASFTGTPRTSSPRGQTSAGRCWPGPTGPSSTGTRISSRSFPASRAATGSPSGR